MPSDEVSTITPAHLFIDPNPLVVHMCYECRRFNGAREMEAIDNERQQLPMALCKICCACINALRSAKFYQHDLSLVKRRHNL